MISIEARSNALCLLVLLAANLSWSAGHAQTGPFSELTGAWTGGGHLLVKDGGKEAIRCRATYSVGSGGTTLEQSLRCASDSYRFDLTTQVTASGNSLAGSWKETSRDINGNISGRVNGSNIEGLVEANGFSGSLSVRTTGKTQTISIRSQNTDFHGVDVSLKRS